MSTEVRIHRVVLDGVAAAERPATVAAFRAELTHLLSTHQPGPHGTVAPERPGRSAPEPGSPRAVGEEAARAVHARLLREAGS